MYLPETPLLDERAAASKFGAARDFYARRQVLAARGWLVDAPSDWRLRVMFSDRSGRVRAGVLLQMRNYDALPPSLVFLDESRRPHSQESLGVLLTDPGVSHVPPFLQNGFMLVGQAGGYLPGTHPFTNRPFLCIRGTWEFHMHPQHADVMWEWIRNDSGYNLQYLIENAQRAFRPDLFG